MPFRWLRTCFRCFYCYEMFEIPDELKTHQTQHSKDDIEKAINNYYEENVFVDVSDLSCKLCTNILENIHQLVDHLMTEHGMYFDINAGLCMIPFELDEKKQCIVCEIPMKSYGNLVAHMVKKHINVTKMFCAVCNTRFKSTKQICSHLQGVQNETSCSECSVNLEASHLGDHMRGVHGKRYRCLACWEFFKTHYQRSLHMASIHKRRELFKCLYCPRTFIFASILRRHIRERHLKERNAICHICGWKTFGQHELNAHMVKHVSVKEHKCPFCEKMFKSKKNMRQHCVKSHQ
ncbi:unnamed protein product [Colias eurytheme]|nr:unnamed protein product [Colias eurytheme]